MSISEFKLYDKSLYLRYGISRDATFIVMGSDFTMQFPVEDHDPLDTSIQAQCMAAGFTPTSDFVSTVAEFYTPATQGATYESH